MGVSYKRLWKLLIDKNMKKRNLKEAAGLSACTLLYRTLLEAATRKAYAEKKPIENKVTITYQENSLPTMMSKLAKHNVLKLSEAERASIVEYINNKKITAILNNYIHHPKLVDTEIVLTSWVTMKEYIKACLA